VAFLEIHEDDYIELHDELPRVIEATLLARRRGFWGKSRIYGEDGTVWRTAPAPEAVPRPSLVLRIPANTVYNPTRRVPVICERAGECGLTDLSAPIARCVARDEDILTQFMQASEINDQLGRAATFRDVVALMRRMQGGHEVARFAARPRR